MCHTSVMRNHVFYKSGSRLFLHISWALTFPLDSLSHKLWLIGGGGCQKFYGIHFLYESVGDETSCREPISDEKRLFMFRCV